MSLEPGIARILSRLRSHTNHKHRASRSMRCRTIYDDFSRNSINIQMFCEPNAFSLYVRLEFSHISYQLIKRNTSTHRSHTHTLYSEPQNARHHTCECVCVCMCGGNPMLSIRQSQLHYRIVLCGYRYNYTFIIASVYTFGKGLELHLILFG